MGTIREGKWDCRTCGAAVRGSLESCHACGWTRDGTVEFYLDDDAPVVTDAAEVAAARAGPDWLCDCCGNANAAARPGCASCGSPRGTRRARHGDVAPPTRSALEENESAAAKPTACVVIAEPSYHAPAYAPAPPPVVIAQPAPAPAPVVIAPVIDPPRRHHHAPPVETAPRREHVQYSSSRSSGGIAAGIIAVLAIAFVGGLAAIIWGLARGHEDVATVRSVAWSRSIKVEALTPVPESAWDGAPSGAHDITHKPEIDHYDKVLAGSHVEYVRKKVQEGTTTEKQKKTVKVGTKTVVIGHKNLGNGRFEDVTREDPVYEDRLVDVEVPNMVFRDVPKTVDDYEDRPRYREKYYYLMDRWKPARTADAAGGPDRPRWPDPALVPGKEREAGRSEEYLVVLDIAGKGAQRAINATDEADFIRYKVGSAWKVEWNHAGSIKVLGPMQLEAEAGGR